MIPNGLVCLSELELLANNMIMGYHSIEGNRSERCNHNLRR